MHLKWFLTNATNYQVILILVSLIYFTWRNSLDFETTKDASIKLLFSNTTHVSFCQTNQKILVI